MKPRWHSDRPHTELSILYRNACVCCSSCEDLSVARAWCPTMKSFISRTLNGRKPESCSVQGVSAGDPSCEWFTRPRIVRCPWSERLGATDDRPSRAGLAIWRYWVRNPVALYKSIQSCSRMIANLDIPPWRLFRAGNLTGRCICQKRKRWDRRRRKPSVRSLAPALSRGLTHW